MNSGSVNKETWVEGNPLCWVALRNAIEHRNECNVRRVGASRFFSTENETDLTINLIVLWKVIRNQVLSVTYICHSWTFKVYRVEGRG